MYVTSSFGVVVIQEFGTRYVTFAVPLVTLLSPIFTPFTLKTALPVFTCLLFWSFIVAVIVTVFPIVAVTGFTVIFVLSFVGLVVVFDEDVLFLFVLEEPLVGFVVLFVVGVVFITKSSLTIMFNEFVL